MSVILAHSIWTVLMLVAFIGIVIWAWSGRQRRRFEEAARIPLDDDDRPGDGATPARGANLRDDNDG